MPLLGFIGHWEVIVIGGVVVLLFMGTRIPQAMRSLGRGLNQFKKGLRESDEDDAPAPGQQKKLTGPPPEGGDSGGEGTKDAPADDSTKDSDG